MRLCRQQQVVEHGVALEHAGDLETARQASSHALMRRQRGQLDPIQAEAAFIQRQQARDQIDQGGFTRAIGADQRVNLARLNGDIDMIGRQQSAKTLDQTLGLEQACCTHCVFSLRSNKVATPLGAKNTTRISISPIGQCQYSV
ncbi:hypothetical protein SDC9_175706 [bioreactor metagenome]|uniref:Uncharacterized protein n=1 Tax=bioreactor metagenome TaxID=1076179 RepID=A0A645GNG4_9ZZZZ